MKYEPCRLAGVARWPYILLPVGLVGDESFDASAASSSAFSKASINVCADGLSSGSSERCAKMQTPRLSITKSPRKKCGGDQQFRRNPDQMASRPYLLVGQDRHQSCGASFLVASVFHTTRAPKVSMLSQPIAPGHTCAQHGERRHWNSITYRLKKKKNSVLHIQGAIRIQQKWVARIIYAHLLAPLTSSLVANE